MSYALELYVEERGRDGWVYAGAMAPYMGDVGPGVPDMRPEPFYWTGDHDVMAILSGFRNPQPGWAGPFEFVAPPRGLPAELSPALAARTTYTPPEEHLFPAGWFTLAELLAFDWTGRHHRWKGDPVEGMMEGMADAAEWVSFALVAHEFLDRVVRPLARRGADPARVRVVWWIR